MQFGSCVLTLTSNTSLGTLSWEVSQSKSGTLEPKSSFLVSLMTEVVPEPAAGIEEARKGMEVFSYYYYVL